MAATRSNLLNTIESIEQKIEQDETKFYFATNTKVEKRMLRFGSRGKISYYCKDVKEFVQKFAVFSGHHSGDRLCVNADDFNHEFLEKLEQYPALSINYYRRDGQVFLGLQFVSQELHDYYAARFIIDFVNGKNVLAKVHESRVDNCMSVNSMKRYIAENKVINGRVTDDPNGKVFQMVEAILKRDKKPALLAKFKKLRQSKTQAEFEQILNEVPKSKFGFRV